MPTVFYPPTIPWDRLRQRPHQILRHLAKIGYTCVYHDPATVGRRTPKKEVESGLFVLSRDASPLAVPRDVPVILWFTLPDHHVFAGGVYAEDFVVFDLCDEPEEEFASWKKGLEEAFSVASMVFCASYLLYEKYRERHPRVYYLPNAADCETFKTAGPIPDDFPKRSGPVAGYHGVLATWIDWNLVYRVSRKLPHWNFVFVGPVLGLSKQDLPYSPNIFYLGEKNYDDLPGYVRRFDVGIIPFKVSAMTRYSNPIKMYEYLACGKPVVSTDIHEVAICPFARVARNYQEFSFALEDVLRESAEKPGWAKKREDWARKNSWHERALRVDRIVREAIEKGVG